MKIIALFCAISLTSVCFAGAKVSDVWAGSFHKKSHKPLHEIRKKWDHIEASKKSVKPKKALRYLLTLAYLEYMDNNIEGYNHYIASARMYIDESIEGYNYQINVTKLNQN